MMHKMRETGGVEYEVRRTGRTAQEQLHSRGFPQDYRSAASPLLYPVARSRVTTSLAQTRPEITRTLLRGKTIFGEPGNGTLLRREIGACHVSRICPARSIEARSNIATQHTSACSCVIVRCLHYDR